jgi:uncharacterized membrane protein
MEMKEYIVPLGVVIIFLGFALVFVGSFLAQKDIKTESKFFVGGVFGFIPFGFGNDRSMVMTGLILTVMLFVLWLVLGKYF